jgi:hypothetical protein
VLDLVLTNNICSISNVCIKCSIGKSDHNTVHLLVNIETTRANVNEYVRYYDCKNDDFENLNIYLSHITWDYEFSFVFTIKEYWNIFLKHLTPATFVPLITRKVNVCKNRKTYARHSRNMFNRKVLLWKRWRTSSLPQDKLAYKNHVSKCRTALSDYLQNKELDVISSSIVGRLYRYVNSKRGST